MQINLPNDVDPVVQAKAAAAGFGEDIGAYVAHLIVSDEPAAQNSEDGKSAANGSDNALAAFEKLGLVGCISDAPADLATNPKHMEGFGQNDAGSR